jgi:2-polyprenyl-3-methyl-5-hydroxy-6-metoxy-1,4-benzoquinol methylase
MTDPGYADRLQSEAAVWSASAADLASTAVPEWAVHRCLRHNAVQYAAHVDALLERVRPGMRVLELGCSSGWLSLAMARRGAIVHGLDIAEGALAIGRAHYESVAEEVAGRVTYAVADVNDLRVQADAYDLVVAKGVLHHLTDAASTVARVYDALSSGGLFWVCDNHGHESLRTAVAAGALMFVLPTEVSYQDKLRGLLHFGWKSPDRIRASMEAEGLSPFEGGGRDVDWPGAIDRLFDVESKVEDTAITGYIAAQLAPSDAIVMPFLRVLRAVDRALVHLHLLRSTGLVVYARKPIGPR